MVRKGSEHMRRPDGRETWYRLLEWDKGIIKMGKANR